MQVTQNQKVKQNFSYLFFANIGRILHSLILHLTSIQNYFDKKAGDYWTEDW